MLWITAVAGGCTDPQGAAGPPLFREHVRLQLIAENPRLVPGTTNYLAVLFELDPDWHVYAPLRNDTGLPISLAPRAPEGFSFREPLWPTPHRLVSPGSILDHVYTNRVAIVLPLDVPEGVPAGETVTLRCGAEWLSCGTSCILGEGMLEIVMTVGEKEDLSEGTRPVESSRRGTRPHPIRESLKRVPVPLDRDTTKVALRWDPGRWTIEVAGATELTFHPADRCAPLHDPLKDTTAAANRLDLRLLPDAPAHEPLVGVLEVWQPAGPKFYGIDVSAGPGTGSRGLDRRAGG